MFEWIDLFSAVDVLWDQCVGHLKGTTRSFTIDIHKVRLGIAYLTEIEIFLLRVL